MLEISALNQYYGGSHILWDMALQIPQGQCSVILGRNGVGKTTLLKCLMGLLPLKSGQIHLKGIALHTLPPDRRAQLGLGYVPQGREIFNRLTVEDNLQIAARGEGQRLARAYTLFPVLREMRKRRGGDLSGGQQQQLAIGRALMLNPKVLILDEPTEGIQPNVVHEIGRVIRHLMQEEGMTVLLVEQKLGFARKLGQHFCLMSKGRNVAQGAMVDLTDALVRQHLAV